MSSNLPWTPLAENQENPEAPINDAFGLFDAAISGTYVADVTSDDVDLTAVQTVNRLIVIDGATVADRIVTFPEVVRLCIVQSLDTNTEDVTLKRGTTEISIAPDDLVIVSTDGSENGIEIIPIRSSGGVAAEPITVGIYAGGTMDDNEIIFRFIVAIPFVLPAGAANSAASSTVAATGSTTLTLKKNGADFGTIVFSAAGTTGAFTQASDASFAADDILSIHAPATADTTLANTSITLYGEKI